MGAWGLTPDTLHLTANESIGTCRYVSREELSMFDLLQGDRFAVVGTNRGHPAVKKRLDFVMTGGGGDGAQANRRGNPGQDPTAGLPW